MVSAAVYRGEAMRCRALAVATHDAEAATRWLRIAKDYDGLADAIAAEEARQGVPSIRHTPMQQQPMQQQSKVDDKANDPD